MIIWKERAFRLCGVVSEVERRYTKKDAKPWARFTILWKKTILSMFPEAYEQYGLMKRENHGSEGIATNRDGEIRVMPMQYS